MLKQLPLESFIGDKVDGSSASFRDKMRDDGSNGLFPGQLDECLPKTNLTCLLLRLDGKHG